MNHRLFNIPVLLLLIAPGAGFAAEPVIPFTFHGLYEVNLGNIRFAKMGLEIEQQSDYYKVKGDIKVTGIVKMFTQHSSHTTVDGSGDNFNYPARAYETRYRTKKKHKYVKLIYESNTVKTEVLEPPENPAKRPVVPNTLKKNSYDPLSFILKMRMEIISALKSNKKDFSLNVYDGRRLTKANFNIIGRKAIRLDGKKTDVVIATVKRELTAGFTESEREDYSAYEPVITIYFSDDARFIPLKFETSFWLGTLSATLIKECRTGESCLLGIKE